MSNLLYGVILLGMFIIVLYSVSEENNDEPD